jgi:hypothetical protein
MQAWDTHQGIVEEGIERKTGQGPRDDARRGGEISKIGEELHC